MDNAMTNASAFPGSSQSMFAAYADTLSFELSNCAVSGQHRCTMPELEGSSTSGVMTPAGVLFKFEEVDSLIYPDDPGEVVSNNFHRTQDMVCCKVWLENFGVLFAWLCV